MSRTIDQIAADEARLSDEMKRRSERIANCEVENTDCALSMWAADQNSRKLSMERELAENNGKAPFTGLFTLNGQRVRAKRINGKFGPYWVLLDVNDKAHGKSLPFHDHRHIGKRAATNLRKKGYEVREEWAEAGIGSDCAGAGCPVNYYFYRKDGGYPKDAIAVEDAKMTESLICKVQSHLSTLEANKVITKYNKKTRNLKSGPRTYFVIKTKRVSYVLSVIGIGCKDHITVTSSGLDSVTIRVED